MTLRPLGVRLSSGVAISNSSLSLQDLDTPDNELIFVLMKKPDHGKTQTGGGDGGGRSCCFIKASDGWCPMGGERELTDEFILPFPSLLTAHSLH